MLENEETMLVTVNEDGNAATSKKLKD